VELGKNGPWQNDVRYQSPGMLSQNIGDGMHLLLVKLVWVPLAIVPLQEGGTRRPNRLQRSLATCALSALTWTPTFFATPSPS
jgi:hypothetical protein